MREAEKTLTAVVFGDLYPNKEHCILVVFKIAAHGICVKLDVMYGVIILSCCLMILPLAFSINCVISLTELGERDFL